MRSPAFKPLDLTQNPQVKTLPKKHLAYLRAIQRYKKQAVLQELKSRPFEQSQLTAKLMLAVVYNTHDETQLLANMMHALTNGVHYNNHGFKGIPEFVELEGIENPEATTCKLKHFK